MAGIVGTYGDNDNVLWPLIMLLNDFSKPGAPNPIPEIRYLYQMSETGSLPGDKFYPRAIITYMINTHTAFQENVRRKPSLEKRFQCHFFERGQWRIYEFSNTLTLEADIIILQYLYIYRKTRGNFSHRIYQLTRLIMNKYTIYEDIDCNTCEINYETCEISCKNRNCFRNDPKMVTLGRIFYSYVSVALWMYNLLPEFIANVRTIFPASTLPGMIFSWLFPIVLPNTLNINFKYLLAVNMAISAAFEIFSTLTIYNRIVRCCTMLFDVYTNEMRIDICMKLGILYKQNNTYFFSSNLSRHSFYGEIAKNTIRFSIRRYDKTVNEAFKQFDRLDTLFIVVD